MGLPLKLPFLNKQPKVDYYLALVLRDEKIASLVFEQRSGKITIISKHEEPLEQIIEKTPLSELVEIIDKNISSVEDKLPVDLEIKDTVFGLKDSWVEDKKIRKEYLAKLKHICGELSLSPIGFIVLSEAIVHLIKQEEGTPVSALLTEVGKDVITVSLFRAGKLIETKERSITTTPMHAVDDALKEFEDVEILPSRVILFHSVVGNEDDLKDALAQKFITHQWSKNLPFLHVPQISLLPHGFDGKAVVAGAATQLGFSLTGLPQDSAHAEIQTIAVEKSHKEKFPEDEKAEEEVDGTDSDTFGFVLDQDISTLPAAHKASQKTSTTLKEEMATSDTDDKIEDGEIEEPAKAKKYVPAQELKINDNFYEETDESKTYSAKKQTNPALYVSNFMKRLKIISLPEFSYKKIFFIPPAILLLLVGLVILYFFQLKATVTLLVSPKSVNEIEKITLSTKSDNDFTKNLIAAKEITVSLEGASSTDATGQTEIGDKAKGNVTIYNSDETKKTFKERTVITSEKGLAYVTDKEVSVASSSGDIFTGIKSGTAQVAVTAKQIGLEYNLPSNSKFSIEGTSVVAAKNESAFSGGSKKKVTVVTKKDVDKLKEALPKSLEPKAKNELRKKLGPEEELLSGFIKVELTKNTLDKEVAEEAKTVKLSGTVTFKSIAYNKNDLLSFAENSIKQRYAKDELSKNIQTKISGLKNKNDSELTGIAAINAGLLPKIDTENMKNELVGKSFKEAKESVQSASQQIKKVDIQLSPNLPFLPQIMPQRSGNITIIIQPS